MPTRFLHDCRRTAARNLIRANVPERVTMLLTGHKSRASSTATTSSTSRNCSTPGTSWSPIWRSRRRRPAGEHTRPAPPPRAPHHPSASYDAAPRKGARPPGTGAWPGGGQWPDTARLCAAAQARATDTNRPAIVAHAATGRADAAEHEHAPGPAAGACWKAGCHSPAQGYTRQRGVA